jgi:hypothetical protein
MDVFLIPSFARIVFRAIKLRPSTGFLAAAGLLGGAAVYRCDSNLPSPQASAAAGLLGGAAVYRCDSNLPIAAGFGR